MAVKKNSKYHRHFLYHTRIGFYSLVAAAVILGGGVIMLFY